MRDNPLKLMAFTLCLPQYLATITRTETDEFEKQFNLHFGNYPFVCDDWETAQEWYKEPGRIQLKKLCASAHEVSGRGECIVDIVLLGTGRLVFLNEKYQSRNLATLGYGINGTLWYLAEGVREDCVFYLKVIDNIKLIFNLEEQVCGVEPLGMYIPPPIPDPLDY